jgi:hypothetical protein
MSRRIDRIQGTLAAQDGSVRQVRLIATIAELRGQHGIEDEQVARIELDSPVPDDDYSLSYYHGRPYNQRVSVKHGVLVAAN